MSDGKLNRSVVSVVVRIRSLFSLHQHSFSPLVPPFLIYALTWAEKRAFIDLEAPPPVDSEVSSGI